MLDRSDSAAAVWTRVGDELREARERCGLTLCELSRRTKITPALLEALENGDFERVPRGPFRRGFARAFALEVGLDADRLLAGFQSEADPVPQPVAPPPDPDLTSNAFTSRLVISAVIVMIAIVAPRWFITSNQDQVLAAVGTAGVQTADATPAPATTVGTQPQQTAEPAPPLVLVLRAVDEVWIQADADGQRIAYGLLPKDTEKTFTARTGLSVRVGDAGAVEYTVNGVPAPPLGPRGFVRDIQLSVPPPQ